jgi:protein TonB
MKILLIGLFLASSSSGLAWLPEAVVAVENSALYDEVPKPKLRALPKYPPELKKKNIKGEVRVEFKVNQEGKVHDMEIIHSDHPAFSREAKAALGNWKFEPAKLKGKAVAYPNRMQIALVFNVSSE